MGSDGSEKFSGHFYIWQLEARRSKRRRNCSGNLSNDLDKNGVNVNESILTGNSSPQGSYLNSWEEQTAASPSRQVSECSDSPKEDDDFWCPRCCCRIQEPRILPCLHPICSPCVNELMDPKTGESSSDNNGSQAERSHFRSGCPICDFPLPTPTSKVPLPHYLLQNHLVIDAIRRSNNAVLCCDTCHEDVQATLHCSTCLRNFCQECGNEHQQYLDKQSFSVHQIRPIYEAVKLRRAALCQVHPTRTLRFYCIACQQVVCRECVWQGTHRGHASEDARSAARTAMANLTMCLRNARHLLNMILVETNRVYLNYSRPRSAHDFKESSYFSQSERHDYRYQNRATISVYRAEKAKERIEEYARLQKARSLLDAVNLGEELLSDGSDVEILSLSKVIVKRLRFLGVSGIPRRDKELEKLEEGCRRFNFESFHSGVYHCCTFCSSGGKREVPCACGGTMPGGYKGCGHGHSNHPGAYHWSCCASTDRFGSCLIPRKFIYQMIL